MLWWVASYPKSGNTWLRAILTALRADARVDINAMDTGAQSCARAAIDRCLDVRTAEMPDALAQTMRPIAYRAWARSARDPIYCKVHDRFHRLADGSWLFPPEAARGGLVVVRDPRAVAVSFAHHRSIPIDRAIADMADPAFTMGDMRRGIGRLLPQTLGGWSDHVASWLDAPLPVTLLRYEEMVRDPLTQVLRVAQAVGLECSPDLGARVVAATRFSQLRAQEDADGFCEKPPGARRFFRDGRAQGWRDVLSPAQRARIERDHGAMMARVGIAV